MVYFALSPHSLHSNVNVRQKTMDFWLSSAINRLSQTTPRQSNKIFQNFSEEYLTPDEFIANGGRVCVLHADVQRRKDINLHLQKLFEFLHYVQRNLQNEVSTEMTDWQI